MHWCIVSYKLVCPAQALRMFSKGVNIVNQRVRGFRARRTNRQTPIRVPVCRRWTRVSIVIAVFPILVYFCLYVFATKIRPPITLRATAVAKKIATDVLNEAVTEPLARAVDKAELVHIVQANPSTGPTIARFDFAAMTALQSEAIARAETQFSRLSTERLYIPMSSIVSGAYLVDPSWRLPVHLTLSGAVQASLRPEIHSIGLNQSVHIIYLDLTAEVTVLGPFFANPATVQTHTPLAYIVMSGHVPQAFYNSNSGVSPVAPVHP